ncbi:hypothetical protein GCM10028797_12620 [Dyella agri]
MLVQHGGKFPCQVYRIADAGIHALAAGRAVDMRGVAQQKHTPLPEGRCHPVMHVVGREPVHLHDVESEMCDRAWTDVVERQFAVFIGGFAHGADQAYAALFLEREDREKVGVVEIDMQLMVGGRALGLYVSDVKPLCVSSPGKGEPQPVPDRRARAVATGKIGRMAGCLRAIGQPERGAHAVMRLVKCEQLGLTLHRHSQCLQPFDQQSLVGVLRKDQPERKRAKALADLPERHPCGLAASDPQIDAGNLDATADNRIGQADLPVKLQRARLHRQGARGASCFGGLVDDPYGNAEPGQPQRQHEAGRTGAGDQHVGVMGIGSCSLHGAGLVDDREISSMP